MVFIGALSSNVVDRGSVSSASAKRARISPSFW
jgi:hypothetical protein